jgi:hypothetical protein
MGELLFRKTGPGPSGRTPSVAWATMGELLFLFSTAGRDATSSSSLSRMSANGWRHNIVIGFELSLLGDVGQLELVPIHFIMTLCVGIDQTLLVLGKTLQSCQLDLHVPGVVGELDGRLHKSDVVGSEDATVMSPAQVVEVRVMRAATVAHLLTTGIKGADLPVHVSVDTAV